MNSDSVAAPFVSSHLTAEEVDSLYKQALKKIEVALFSARLDVVCAGSAQSQIMFRDLSEQAKAVEKDYRQWLASKGDRAGE